MITCFAKTSIGYSHVTANKRCQDFSASYSDEERTIVTACDGHGGNVYIRSHLGSKFASNAVIDVLREIEKTAFYKAKKEELTKASQNVAMKAYQKAQQAQQKNSSSNEDSDTVDADYTDVD